MSNLIPVKLPDKNGVMVTRWVKPSDASGTGKKGIPAPIATSSPQDQLSHDLNLSVNADISAFGLDKGYVLGKSRSLPPRTVAALLELRKKSVDQYTVDCIIASALHGNETPDMLENIALVYNDPQYADMDWSHQKHDAYSYITETVRGLKQYPQYAGVTNFTEHGEGVKLQARTLAKLVYEGEGYSGIVKDTETHEGNAVHFINPEFVQLTIDNCDTEERAGDYLDLVYDKGCDPAVLKEILKTTVPLRDGVL